MNAPRTLLAAIALAAISAGCTQQNPPPTSPSLAPKAPEMPAPPSSNPTKPDDPSTPPRN